MFTLYNVQRSADMTVTVSQKGWIVIPAELRKKHNLKPGARVLVVDYGGVLALVPRLSSPVQEAAGMLKGRKSLTRALLAEHRAERRKETRRGR
jgi:AbrB family looped-hinge helix DNA binding protein